MALTTQQLQSLKADIVADPVLGQLPNNFESAYQIADAMNTMASPDWYVWRSSVSGDELRNAIIGGGGATQLDALTASKRDSLLWACSDTLTTSNASVRAALDDFCGSQNTLKAALVAVQKRKARRIEKVLSTGTGSSASPATMDYEGTITVYDAKEALDLA